MMIRSGNRAMGASGDVENRRPFRDLPSCFSADGLGIYLWCHCLSVERGACVHSRDSH